MAILRVKDGFDYTGILGDVCDDDDDDDQATAPAAALAAADVSSRSSSASFDSTSSTADLPTVLGVNLAATSVPTDVRVNAKKKKAVRVYKYRCYLLLLLKGFATHD